MVLWGRGVDFVVLNGVCWCSAASRPRCPPAKKPHWKIAVGCLGFTQSLQIATGRSAFSASSAGACGRHERERSNRPDLRAPNIGGRLHLEVSQGNGGFNHKKSTNMWRFTIAPTIYLWHFCVGTNAQRISSSYHKRYDCIVGNSTR